MANLPITSNASQPANTAGTMKGNGAPGDRAADVQPFGQFASLLARQIGGADAPGPGIAQIAIALRAIDPNLEDMQDQPATAMGTTSDPANALTAMLLQIPQEMRAQFSNGAASDTAGERGSPAIDITARKTTSLADAMLDVTNIAWDKTEVSAMTQGKTEVSAMAQSKTDAPAIMQEKTEPLATATGKQIVTDAMSQSTFKRAELPPGLDQPAQSTTQTTNPPVMPAMMPNMLAANKIPDSPQTVATPLGGSGWADDFSQKISWAITQQNQVAELHLNPPDLGPLNVVLKISDNQATALFTSPHSAVRDAVENAIPKLREVLADNGIMLGNTMVSDQSPRDRDAAALMNRGFSTAAQREISDGAPEPVALTPSQNAPTRRHNGMVDTFA